MSCVSTNLLAETEQTNRETSYEPTLYISDDYDTESKSNIESRTRGNCTDVYSKAWCDSHGYENNRPVAGTALIPMIPDEVKCYLSSLSSSTAIILTAKVTQKNGVYYALADVVFQFFLCRF